MPTTTKEYVYSRDGKLRGTVVGTGYWCQMESCQGLRIPVRWPSGAITYPCSRGLKARGKHRQIA